MIPNIRPTRVLRRAHARIPLAVLVLALAGGTALLAAQRLVTLEQLARGAERIVVGEVETMVATRDEWPGVGTLVFTDVTIRIAERWKGPADGDTLTVRVPGGTDAATGDTQIVSEAPRFRLGEKVLVFAREFHGRPWVFCWSQGKYEVIVQRVDGSPGNPIAEDILLPPLRKRVEAILREAPELTPADGKAPGAEGGGR